MTVLNRLLAAVLFSLVAAWPALAQDYPTKPITLIVPFPASGTTDIFMRVVADAAASRLGQRIIVDNRPGGGGGTGPGTMAVTAKPDGYTIAQMPVPVFRMGLMQDTAWSKDDFSYIIHMTGYVFNFIIRSDRPYKTWDEFVAYAKKNPDTITYGTSGVGGSPHLGMEQIADKVGIKLKHIPYKGAADYNQAIAGNHIDSVVGGGSTKPLLEEGKVIFLNVWTSKRSPSMPEIPTLLDLGTGLVIESPFGIAGPKGMDPKIVAKLHDAFKAALSDQAVIEAAEKYDMVISYKNSADYKKSVDELVVYETALMKKLGLLKPSLQSAK